MGLAELIAEHLLFMFASGFLWIGVAILWGPVLILLHEAGHAAGARLCTPGTVAIEVRLFSGWCSFDPDRPLSRRDELAFAAGGPAVTLLTGLALLVLALISSKPGSMASVVLMTGAAGSAFGLVDSLVPVTYGTGLRRGESDGRVLFRILRGTPPGRDRVWDDRLEWKPELTIRPVFVVLFALIAVAAFAIDPILGLLLLALFGGAWVLQSTANS